MRTAVAVTGGAAGLGRVISRTLLARGRPVVIVDRDVDALHDALAEPIASDARVDGVLADLSTTAGVEAAAAALAQRDLGGLVNNAGGWLPGPQYPDAPPERWQAALTLGLVAPMLLTQRLWPMLAARSGAVVSIGSSGGEGGDAYGSPEYGAAKAGLRRWTASLGGRADVRVMAVVPGWIGLERAHAEWAALPVEQQQAVGGLIPPEEIADVVVALLDHGRPGQVVERLRGPEVEAPDPRPAARAVSEGSVESGE